MKNRLWPSWIRHRHWWAALLVAVTLHWFAVESHHLINEIIHAEWPTRADFVALSGYAVLVVVSVQWLFRVRSEFYGRPRTRHMRHDEPAEQRPHLILFLSELPVDPDDPRRGVPAWFNPTDDLGTDLDQLEALKQADPRQMWRWEMPLRALAHHAPRLRTATLMCSDQSIRQVAWFARLASRYRQLDGVRFRVLVDAGKEAIRLQDDFAKPLTGGWPFEKFDVLSGALLKLLDHMVEHEKVDESEIMIDFTGGPKVPSVVAAVVTVNRRIKAQYVDTNRPYHPISYDIVLEVGHETGLEL